ncbi:MAG: hypothetical protein HQL44_17040 [Alphaproteobacteria bacterium]|nr:hypothetical protein [Alphaproteobacteria bacterium]
MKHATKQRTIAERARTALTGLQKSLEASALAASRQHDDQALAQAQAEAKALRQMLGSERGKSDHDAG